MGAEKAKEALGANDPHAPSAPGLDDVRARLVKLTD